MISKNLRVAFLGDVFSLYEKAGIYRYADQILQGLLESNVDLTLFLSSARVSKEFERANTVIADYYNVGKVLNKSAFLPNLLFFIRNLKLASDLNKLVDVAYSPQCRIPDVSYLMNLRIPMITTLHDVHAFKTKVPLFYKMQYVFRYTSPKILVNAEKIFLAVPTMYVKNQVIEFLHIPSEKIEVIPSAVSAPSSVFNISKRRARSMAKDTIGVEDYVLFIARQGNVPMVLSIIKLLNASYHLHVPIVIAGIGIDKVTTKGLVRTLGLEESAIVLGAIPESLKWILLRGARLFLSLEEPTSGFGIPQVEAMSVGTPVVASDTGPTSEVIGDGGLLTKYDEKEMAEAIYKCYNDQSIQKKLSRKGFERAKMFQPKNVASCLLKYMEKIMSKS